MTRTNRRTVRWGAHKPNLENLEEGLSSNTAQLAKHMTIHRGVGGKGDACTWRRKPPLLTNAYFVTSCGREFDEPSEHKTGDDCPGCGKPIKKVRK